MLVMLLLPKVKGAGDPCRLLLAVFVFDPNPLLPLLALPKPPSVGALIDEDPKALEVAIEGEGCPNMLLLLLELL